MDVGNEREQRRMGEAKRERESEREKKKSKKKDRRRKWWLLVCFGPVVSCLLGWPKTLSRFYTSKSISFGLAQKERHTHVSTRTHKQMFISAST